MRTGVGVGEEEERQREKKRENLGLAGWLASWKWDLFNHTGPHTQRGPHLV